MTDKRKNIIDRVASLPEELLDEVQDSVNGIVELHDVRGYHATPEELAAIDDAERSGIATEEDVEAAFAKFQGARMSSTGDASSLRARLDLKDVVVLLEFNAVPVEETFAAEKDGYFRVDKDDGRFERILLPVNLQGELADEAGDGFH